MITPNQRRALTAPRHTRSLLAQDQVCASCMAPVTFDKEHCRELSSLYREGKGKLDHAVFLCTGCLPYYHDVEMETRH